MSRLCALLGVTRAGYYAWAARAESAHSERDRVVVRAIRKIFEASDGTMGARACNGSSWRRASE